MQTNPCFSGVWNRWIALLWCAMCLSGCCGTFLNLFKDPKMYGGVREELVIANALKKGGGRGGFGMGGVVLMALPAIAVEAVVVAATDTAFLPITFTIEAIRGAKDSEGWEPREEMPTAPQPQPQPDVPRK